MTSFNILKNNIQNTRLAPICIFAYNRPHHLNNLLTSLSRCHLAEYSKIFIFIDGPKNQTDIFLCDETKKISNKDWPFENVSVYTKSTNLGLADSIISGVTQILEKSPSIIVLEDDLIVHPDLLLFLNAGLQIYENTAEVASIHGYNYPIKLEENQPFFLPGADCWGWATWADRWADIEWNSELLFNELKKRSLTKSFDLNNSFQFTKMLQRQSNGEVDSWAIRWHAHNFLSGKITLYPPTTLVLNKGNDSFGTHGGKDTRYDSDFSDPGDWKIKQEVRVSIRNLQELEKFYRRNFKKINFHLLARSVIFKIKNFLQAKSKEA